MPYLSKMEFFINQTLFERQEFDGKLPDSLTETGYDKQATSLRNPTLLEFYMR